MIDLCAAVAPVEVIIVQGNHDEQRSFYLGDAISCWYHKTKHVTVDNRPALRKYVCFGNNLIGYTHGSNEKLLQLQGIMACEVPDLWGRTVHREWHLGHFHHKKDLILRTEDILGVTIRYMRGLTAADAWTINKGFIGSPREAEGFLWDPKDGIKAQFISTVPKERNKV